MFTQSRHRLTQTIRNPATHFCHTNKASRDTSVCTVNHTIRLVLVAWLVAVSVQSLAATNNPGLVRGSVLNDHGRPVASATIEMRDLHGVKITSGVSDRAGLFTLTSIAPPGVYVVLAADRLWVTEQRISLDSNDRELEFVLPNSAQDFAITHRKTNIVSAAELRIPKQARQYLKLAQQSFRRTNFEEAEAEVDRALKLDASFAAAFSMRAFLRLASRALAGAIDDAQHALSLDSSDPNAYLALGTAYNSLGEFPKAQEALRQALELSPDLWQGQLEMAKAYYGQGSFVVALYEMDQLSNDFPDVHLVRANVLERLGRGNEAVAEFSAFLLEAPEDLRSEQVRRIVAATKLADP